MNISIGSITAGRFTDRTALVTGAARGIGLSVVHRLLAEGCNVAMLDVESDRLEAARATMPHGAAVLPIVCDASDEDSVNRAFGSAYDRFGVVDLVHNNAGVLGSMKPLADLDAPTFDSTMAVNSRGAFLVLREFVRRLVAAGLPGAAVNTSSGAALKTAPGMTAYTMSKHAVIGLTRSAAIEYGHQGIRVNAVCPGRVDTPMASAFASFGDKEVDVVLAARPIPRAAHPDEIADMVLWLLSNEASFVTGGIYAVDGGNAA